MVNHIDIAIRVAGIKYFIPVTAVCITLIGNILGCMIGYEANVRLIY